MSAASAPEPLLELVDVHAGYGSIEVLHGVDLTVPAGAVVVLLGPNGGGKSTTLRACCGLHPITSGQLRIAGTDVTGVGADRLAKLGVCTVPEGRGVFPNLSVKENLWLATGTGPSLATLEAAAYERFPILGDRRSQLAGTLSGGEQQMLALARALGADPVLLILDELSMGLAPLVVSTMYEIVAQLAADGLSILVAEQFAAVVLPIAQSAAIMLHGQVIRAGTPAEIQDELATAYLGG